MAALTNIVDATYMPRRARAPPPHWRIGCITVWLQRISGT